MGRFTNPSPPVVLPDTREGRIDARVLGLRSEHVEFCSDYKKDKYDERLCGERRSDGDRRYSWCFHCLASGWFLMTPENEKDIRDPVEGYKGPQPIRPLGW